MNFTKPTGAPPAAREVRSLDAYHSRVAVQTTNGGHVRYVPGALASALVDGGTARSGSSSGRIRTVLLERSAAACAERIGEPGDGRATGVRFYRWAHLEASGTRIVEHHPRCFLLEPDD
jgi:hypothetical protein